MAHFHHAYFEFRAAALAPDAFTVTGFTGAEALSQPYRFEVDLSVEHDDGGGLSGNRDAGAHDLIGTPATLRIARGEAGELVREVNGIIVEFEERVGHFEASATTANAYRAVLAPRLWTLSLSSQSRIFQNLTVEEIVSGILRDARVDFAFKLKQRYEPREHTTQYKETDLAFVQRLLEYEGIRYHIEHDGGGETVVLSDDAGDAPDIPSDRELPYHPATGMTAPGSAAEAEAVLAFASHARLVTKSAESVDYNYRTPETRLHSTAAGRDGTGIYSDSSAHVMTVSRSDRLTQVRHEEIETTRLVMRGESDSVRLQAGLRFDLGRHHRAPLNQTYLVTSVRHAGHRVRRDRAPDEGDVPYRNAFTCVPASAPYRPPRITPEPKLPGVLTARVESAGGEYAPIDDQGRYRVRFPFDLGTAGDAQATKPVRLAQPYSGPDYGQHFPVYKGSEMVVACVDGNVDRIIGLATVPNPTQASPVTSDNQTENTVRTAAGNHLVLQDRKGKIGIDLRTPTATTRVHLGAAENAVQGIQSSTEATQTLQAGAGVFIKVGPVDKPLEPVPAAADVTRLADDVTDIHKAVKDALDALGIGTDALHNPAFWETLKSLTTGDETGLGWPGLVAQAKGGIVLGTPEGVTVHADGKGIGLHARTGIDLATTTRGINLVAGTGDLRAGTGAGNIGIATGDGDIHVHAVKGNHSTEAQQEVLVMSHDKNITLKTDAKDIVLTSTNKIAGTAKSDISLESQTSVLVKATKDITLTCGPCSVKLEASGTITVKAGPSQITLSASGIEAKGPTVKIKGDATAALEGGATVEVKGGAMATLKGAMAMVEGSGIASIKGALTKVG